MRAERRVAEAALEAARAQAGAGRRPSGSGSPSRSRRLATAATSARRSTTARAAGEAAAAALAAGRGARWPRPKQGRTDGRRGARRAREPAWRGARGAERRARPSATRWRGRWRMGGGAALAELARRARAIERALAAALGDDLEAALGGDGPRRWEGSAAAPAIPPLPAGLEPLARPCRGARRACTAGWRRSAWPTRDDGQALAVGQRLVTRDGRDAALGRVRQHRRRRGGGRAAAARQPAGRARSPACPALEAARRRRAGSARRGGGGGRCASARAAEAGARRRRRRRTRGARRGARRAMRRAAALERLDGQRAALAERRADLDPLVDAAARRWSTRPKRRWPRLPDPARAGRPRSTRARAAAIAAGEAVADARAASATRARETAADRERHAAAGREAGEWRDRARCAPTSGSPKPPTRAMAMADEQRGTGRRARPARPPRSSGSSARRRRARRAVATRRERRARRARRRSRSRRRRWPTPAKAFAAAREARAGAAARAEAQDGAAPRICAAICGEKFECPPPLLPGTARLRRRRARRPRRGEARRFDRLTAERERIGPVNLVAEQELAELDGSRARRRRRARRTAGRRSTACADRSAASTAKAGCGCSPRSSRSTAISAACSRPCSTAARRISNWSRATIRSRRGWRSWPSRRASACRALTLLSGGEQALTAVALIFALFLTNPAPICVLDEVDAPLDDANVDRFCDLLDAMSRADRHALPDRHPQCGDDEPDAPPLWRDDDRAGGQPAGVGRPWRGGAIARRRMSGASSLD